VLQGRSVSASEAVNGTWAKTSGSPHFEHDTRGHFMICRHCSKRIAFEVMGFDKNGLPTFRLSPKQECR
jgi:hypothetical protein